MARRGLKTGFSTGSAAAAAAKAALLSLLGVEAPAKVGIPLPDGGRLEIAVREVDRLSPGQARATVVKDAGDDPDVTNGAAISATVELLPEGGEGVVIAGGPGVGRVTRPGLPVEVGQPAINPVPRAMILEAMAEAWAERGPSGRPLDARVEIGVAEGEKLARRTLNPRLGILGGLSILGTSGLVKPFSHEAYTATIDSALEVAWAAGAAEVVLTTGGRSEKRAMALCPDLAELCFVQIADFFGFALQEAAHRGFKRLGLVSYFGKAVKQAQGLVYTHAHQAAMDLGRLAAWLAEAGAPAALAQEIGRANTARHALDLLRQAGRLDLSAVVGARLLAAARGLAGPGPKLWAALLDYDGRVLYRAEEEGAP